jgi:hypothetical protein
MSCYSLDNRSKDGVLISNQMSIARNSEHRAERQCLLVHICRTFVISHMLKSPVLTLQKVDCGHDRHKAETRTVGQSFIRKGKMTLP